MVARVRILGFLLIAFFVVMWRYTLADAFGKIGTPCIECHKDSTATVKKFHTGGANECEGCHAGKGPALKASDASSTCLLCHEAPQRTIKSSGYYVATNSMDLRTGIPPSQLTPGGDFGWLKKNFFWKSSKDSGSSPGERHGHSIIALDFGYMANTRLSTAPHGNYPSSALSCISCHDPHGKIAKKSGDDGQYRLLGGKGYTTSSTPGIFFTVDAPVAVSPRDYNRSESMTDTRVAYGSGMSEWCGNCHGDSGCAGLIHPSGKCANCGTEAVANYNAYVKSGDINGSAEAAFTSLVPFEEGTDDRNVLGQHAQSNGSYNRGLEYGSNVMCLTCHRAHASGWNSMARWNMDSTYIVYNGKYPGTDNGSPAQYAQGRTAAETRRALYDRPPGLFATAQRGLCNKCHPKD